MVKYYNGNDYISIRNKMILMIFFDTGIRLSELINMKLDQIQDSYLPDLSVNTELMSEQN